MNFYGEILRFSIDNYIDDTHRFEIIITFTGTSLATGHTTEERTSYLSNEIVWGHRFVNMVEYDDDTEEYFVAYDRFDVIEEVNVFFVSRMLAFFTSQ